MGHVNTICFKHSRSGFHESEYHGLLKTWSNSDVQRLLHMLVLDEYLRETLIFVRDIPLAYLKIGTQVEKLMTGKVRIKFAIENAKAKKGKKAEVNLKDSSTATNEELKRIEEDCYNDLLQKCHEMATARNVTVGSVMNNQALRMMAESMPTSEEEMLKIPHVTKANFLKFGKELLDVLQNHAANKAMVMLEMQEEAQNRIDESYSGDDTNWAQEVAGGSSTGASGGRKRKRAFGGKFRKGAKKTATPKRRKTAAKTTAKKTGKGTTATVIRGGNAVTLLKPRTFDSF